MRKQEVRVLDGSSVKLIGPAIEKLIDQGYHIDQVLPLNKSMFLIIVSKEA